MSGDVPSFADCFVLLTGHSPMRWQERLFRRLLGGEIPAALDLPTGLGKTSAMAIWLIARAYGAKLPRRLVYIVDRRAVVDQATAEAEKLWKALAGEDGHLDRLEPEMKVQAIASRPELKRRLGLDDSNGGRNAKKLPISTLRGAHVDNREWLDDPAAAAIIVGTVDMIGSRLLFEGYGVSRKMHPYHAGLLSADALVVLDEAHLVPPFAHLLRAIESDSSLWPNDRALLPRFIVLPLSATQREWAVQNGGRTSFGLEEEDWQDGTASERLEARKQLHVEPLAEKDHDRQLAEVALKLATKGQPARVVVFCNRRERKDEGGGPSARGVMEAIVERAKHEKTDIAPPELLVGARRVHERDEVAYKLQRLGFVDAAGPCEKSAFLVATSAGEVGVDLDADHMVCDLAPWERMVQRLGRVNRRGGKSRQADIIVFDTSGIEKNEDRQARLTATRDLLGRIETDFGGQVGPAALLELRGRVGGEAIEKASTPEPLYPALTRALVDAWAMTSLEHHTGRPEIGPWLRGWVEEDGQTAVVWRTYLPLRIDDNNRAIFSSKKEINDFFDAAPPHESEKLETETYRVAKWLQDRSKRLSSKSSKDEDRVESAEAEELPPHEADESRPDSQGDNVSKLRRGDVVALILSPSAEYEQYLTLGDLASERKGTAAKEDFHKLLIGKIVVLDARFSGLKDGLLEDKADDAVLTADAFDCWSKQAGYRVRLVKSDDDPGKDADWRPEHDFVRCRDAEDDPQERLVIEHYKSGAQSEDARSVSWPQELVKHQVLAEEKIRTIAGKVGLPDDARDALMVAALVHDEGKRALGWQQAFKASRDAKKYSLSGPLAKTRGPIDQAVLDGYRHEFGSLAVFQPEHDWARRLRPDVRKRIDDLRAQAEWFDLMLHLIAAHHGRARPVIDTRGCEDAPPSALQERARDVALRFARLQKRWGPWGLAWWESLLRAADQQASRDNDTPIAITDPHTEAR